MALRDLIKRLRSGYENASDSIAEQVNRARSYLDENAPGLESGAQSLARFLMHASPATAGQAYANDLTGSGDARLRYTQPASLKDAILANPLVADVGNVGHQLAGEPLAYGINRIPAIGNNQLQLGDKTVSAGGPWSGLQRQALLQGGQNAGGPAAVAAKAGVAGLDIATNPLTYMPTGNAPLLAQLGLGLLGVGGFGGATAPAQVARAFTGGAGMAAGSDLAARLSGGNPLAETAGGFAGAILAHRVGAATPGLGSLFKDAEGAAIQRPRSPADLLRPPVLAAEESKPLTGDVFIRGVPSPEAVRIDLQRGTSLHQYGGDIDSIMESANISPRVRRMWRDGELTIDSPQVQEALADAGVEHIPGVGLAQKLDGLAGFDANDPQWGWQRFQNYHGTDTPYVAVYEGANVPYANDAQLAGESAALFKPRRLLGIVPSDQFNPADWTEDAINARLRGSSIVRMDATEGAGSVRGGQLDMSWESAPADPTVALHAGMPIPKGPAVGGLIGGAIGAAWPADSLDERRKNAEKGFLLGAGAGAAPALVRRIAPLGTKAVAAVESLTNPSALANQDIRTRVESGRATNEQWSLHAEKNLAPEARAQAETLMAGATIDPAVAADLRRRAADEATKRNKPGIVEKMDATIGSYRDIMEHPEDYTLTPDAQQAFAKLRAVHDAQLQREVAAGVWDEQRNAKNEMAGKALARRDRLIGNPAAGIVGEVDRVYARAQQMMTAVSRPLLQQADRWQALADKARANEAAARTRGGNIQGTMATPLPRMDRALARAAVRADAAVQATEDWFTTQAEALAGRAETLAGNIDAARSAGVATGDLSIQTAQARATAAVDRFEASAARVARPSQVTGDPAAVRAGSRLDSALAALRTRIATVAERQGAEAVDPILRDFDRLAQQTDKLYDRAAIVATADTPRAALYHLERLQTDLDAAGVQARQAVAGVRQRGVRATTLDADAFAAQARLAEMRAAQARATADKVQEPIARKVGRQMASMQRRAMVADQAATAYARQVERPVENYVYHMLADEGQPLPFGRVTVGGEKGFQKERAYKDYRAMALDNVGALTDDAGHLLSSRVVSGMRAVAEHDLVNALADEIRKPGGDVIPDFMAAGLDAQHGSGYTAGNFKPLDNILVNLRSTKDVQRRLVHQLLGSADLPPGLSQAEMASIRARINRGDVRFLVRNETADYLNNVLGPGGWSNNPAAQAIDQVTGTMRAMRLSTDVAALLMRGVSAGVQSVAANPVRVDRAVTAFGKTMRDAVNPAARARMLRSERYQWWTGHGLEGMTPNDLRALDRPEGGLLAERFWEAGPGALGERVAGGVGRVIGEGPVSLEKWQFGVLMPTMKYHTAEALYNTLRPMKAFAHLTDDQLAAQIATRVNTILSGVSRIRAGVSPDMEWVNRQTLLSPNWTRGQVANLTDVTKGGAEGLLARRFWVGMGVMGLGASALLSVALTGDASVSHIEQLLDPTNPDSITNPQSPNFMRVETPDGGHLNLWGPLATISRAVLRPPASAIGAANTQWQNRDPSEPIYQTIAAVAKEAAGSAADWGNTEPWRQWAEDRKGIHVAMAMDLRANKDRLGRTISIADSGSWERVADALTYTAAGLTPAVADVLLNRRDSAIPQFNPSGAGGLQGAAGFFGADYNPGPDTPAPIAQKVRGFLQQNGIYPGPDPLRAYGRALREGQIPTVAVERFKAQNPDITDYQRAQQDKRQQQQRPAGDEAVQKYTEMRADLGQQRDAALKAAAAQYGQDYNGNAYRKAVEQAWTGYQFALSGAAQKYFNTADITIAQSLVDQKNRRTSRADAVDRAADEYELMRVPDGATPDQRDMVLEARREFLSPGGTADQKYGAGTGADLSGILRDRYQQRGGETYAQYFDAQQVMGQYAAISPYLGMDARTARRAGAALDRARALHQYGLAPSPILAILEDKEIDEDTRIAALRILKDGKRMVNPERMAFRWNNPRMLTFYGDLNNEDYSRLTGAA